MQKPQKINRIRCTWIFDGEVCAHGELKALAGKTTTCEECEFGRIIFKNEIAERELVKVEQSEVKRLKREIVQTTLKLQQLMDDLVLAEQHLKEDTEQLKATQTQHTFRDIKGTAIRRITSEEFDKRIGRYSFA
jgi:hypothetical protein